MTDNLQFYKFSATGNDFILFDNREELFSGSDRKFFMQICQRRKSVGADGVLLIENDDSHDFRMRYFNASDGSETACGNGSRAAAYFAAHTGLTGSTMTFIVGKDSYSAVVKGDKVSLRMPEPYDFREGLDLSLDGSLIEGGYVNTGVPHLVLFCRDVSQCDVETLGRIYRNHALFQPRGANVNFVEVVSDRAIRIRTYERGIENETLSCGTGCVASSIIANKKHGTNFPVSVQTEGGRLRVYREPDGRAMLEGSVRLVYEGKLNRLSVACPKLCKNNQRIN